MTEKIFKLWPALLLCTLALVFLPATAAQAKQTNRGKIGKNATWSYNEKKKVLTIRGKGYVEANDLKKYKKGEYLWLGRDDGSLPMFQKIVFQEGINTIDYCFFALENVKTISLPKSLKKIRYCNSRYIENINGQQVDPWSTTLKKIVVHKKNKKFKISNHALVSKNGKKLYVFPSGKTLDAYKISGKVTGIEQYAFWGADIRKVIIGKKVTKIGKQAFCNSALTEVGFGKSVQRIEYAAFQDCVLSQLKLPQSLSYIDRYAFYACPLTEVTIPSKVNKIRDYAFGNNHKLKKIVFQGNTVVGTDAFADTVKYYSWDGIVDVQVEQPITIVLGKSMKANVEAFCENLGSQITFQIESGNPKYYVKNGDLYTVRGDKLVYECKKEDAKTETPPAAPTIDSAA